MQKAKIVTQEWDKTFPESKQVDHKKVIFHNRYGIELAGDLYTPKNAKGERLAAIAVCGPFGAVKEQASGLYAQTMAERGFLTLAFDPSFYRREWRRYPVYGFPRYQHRGFSGCRGLSLYAGGSGPGQDRHHRDLRLGRHGVEHGCTRYPRQSNGHVHHV